MDVLEYTTRLWKNLANYIQNIKKRERKSFVYIEDYNGDIMMYIASMNLKETER